MAPANGEAGCDQTTNDYFEYEKSPGRNEVRRTFGFRCEAKALSRLHRRGGLRTARPRCAKHTGTGCVGHSVSPVCELTPLLARTAAIALTELVLLFTSLLTIPLARQRFFHAALFTGLQVEGVTFHFFDNVFLLYLTLKPAQRIFKRFAFLHANLCQCTTPPN